MFLLSIFESYVSSRNIWVLCFLVLGCGVFVVPPINSMDFESFVWRFGDDLVGLWSSCKVGASSLFSCFFARCWIFSGCPKCSFSIVSMPPRQKMSIKWGGDRNASLG